jgi:hypothetical protein
MGVFGRTVSLQASFSNLFATMARFSAKRPSEDSSGAVPEPLPVNEDSLFDQDVCMEQDSEADSELWGSEATTVIDQLDSRGRDEKEESNIARAETKAVRSLKFLVYLVLILSAIAVALGESFLIFRV